MLYGRTGLVESGPRVSDVSVFDGDTSASPPCASVGSAAAATPELYGPTTATTDGSATIALAAAVPFVASDESSSTFTLIVQPGMAFFLFACATASSTESRMPCPKLVSPPSTGAITPMVTVGFDAAAALATAERDERARREECGLRTG